MNELKNCEYYNAASPNCFVCKNEKDCQIEKLSSMIVGRDKENKELHDQLQLKDKVIEDLREALEFYADGKNWLDACTPHANMNKLIAQQALNKLKGETKCTK